VTEHGSKENFSVGQQAEPLEGLMRQSKLFLTQRRKERKVAQRGFIEFTHQNIKSLKKIFSACLCDLSASAF